jgi:acetate kinase
MLRSFDEIAVTGHRVVHGGNRFRESVRLTEDVRRGIRELAPYAPLHNPLALAAIEAADRLLGSQAAQIAVFDTSFHSTLPAESYLYPGPRAWAKKGMRRYGFHGISHQYVSRRAAVLAAPVLQKSEDELRMITCHLGNGCSLCALKGGKSLETTMGFTPLEGLMMGSRSGTVDPGLLLYLLKHEQEGIDELDRVFNHESGLLGLSGVSADMREVAAAADRGNRDAAEALDVYVYRLAYFISALLPAIDGLDALVFAGGVGENAAFIRARVSKRLEFLGLSLDEALNAERSRGERIISSAASKVVIAIVPTRENFQIAHECYKFARSTKK